MKTVVITDAKYRASIAAARTLGRGGFRVAAVQARADAKTTPPVSASRYVSEFHWLSGSASAGQADGGEYIENLLEFLSGCDRPVLLCAGAGTLNAVAGQRERFREVCDFLISPPPVLDALNDKAAVQRRCEELDIPTPRRFYGKPDRFPVIVKPRCGEKFGLKAKDRYRVAGDAAEWEAALSAMSAWDPDPVVQEKIDGDGAGVSLLLGRNGELLDALCHRRIREYPISGGPSACCESFYDADLIAQAHKLLYSFGFEGLAMVEYKGGRVLEVNPRIWGSFPLTEKCGSPITLRYAQAAAGETVSYTPCDYRPGVRMRFLLNDSAALFSLLRHGQFGAFVSGIPDCFRAAEALSDRDDPAPMRRYLRNVLYR